MQESWLYSVHDQEAGELDAGLPLTFSFLFQDPKPWGVAVHIQGGFSLLN